MNTITKSDLSEQDLLRIKKSGIVAIDTETGGLNPNRDLLYLIQICDQDGTIDLIKTEHWQSSLKLQQVLLDPATVKVIHFAIMDGGFILKHVRVLPQNIYCTKIASKIARTYASSHSLKSLIEEFTGILINKNMQNTFWGKEALTMEQLDYASNDVRYLINIKCHLDNILAHKGKLSSGITYTEINEKCQALIPTLIHLWLNGWDFGKEDPANIFGR